MLFGILDYNKQNGAINKAYKLAMPMACFGCCLSKVSYSDVACCRTVLGGRVVLVGTRGDGGTGCSAHDMQRGGRGAWACATKRDRASSTGGEGRARRHARTRPPCTPQRQRMEQSVNNETHKPTLWRSWVVVYVDTHIVNVGRRTFLVLRRERAVPDPPSPLARIAMKLMKRLVTSY